MSRLPRRSRQPLSDSEDDMAIVPTRMLRELGVPVPSRRRPLNAAQYYGSMQGQSEEEALQHALAMATQQSYAQYGRHPQSSMQQHQLRQQEDERRRRAQAEAEAAAAAEAVRKSDYEKTMDVEKRAHAAVQSRNPDVRRIYGEQVEARCLMIGRVLVEFFMHRYLSELHKDLSSSSSPAAEAASGAAPRSLAAKAAILQENAQTLAWNARAAYKPWKNVVPDALYDMMKKKLLDVSFTEWMALAILRYYLEDHPSERDMCVIFICALRLPKGVNNHWRTKLLGDTVPFLFQSDFTETAQVLAVRILIAAQGDAAPIDQMLLSPPADSSSEEESNSGGS